MVAPDVEQRASNGDVGAQIALARALRADGNFKDAEAWLRRAVVTGNIEAIADLGLQLYLGQPPVPESVVQEAVKLILAAANAGHASSAHTAALIAAQDPEIPNHWQYALDYAARAAAGGYGLAQFILAFLANEKRALMALSRREPLAPDTWQALRERIDIGALLAAPRSMRVLSTSPYIAIAEGFVPPSMCDWIINRARPSMKKGEGYFPEGTGIILRTNSDLNYGFHELDLVHMAVRQRIANVTGLAQSGLEPPSIYHYATGEEFSPHYDFLDPRVPVLAAEIARTGQCIATALLYLNDDFDGGETHFVDLGIRAKGRKGDALIFRNVDDTGAPDIRTRHAGLPPTRGEKWLFSQFIRDTRQANKLPG